MATTNMRIMVRRDSEANWAANGGVVLLEGEMAFEFNNDSGFMRAERFKVGDGLDTKYEDLPYFQMGITGIDEKTLVMDAKGRVYLADSVLGGSGLGDTISVKDYVDGVIADEAAARDAGDTALGAKIDKEITDRIGGDTALGARIDAEILDRDNADTALGARIDSVAAAFADADSLLGNRIDSVAAAFAAADSLLGDRIDSLTDTVLGIMDEDTSLGARIDTVDAKFGSLTATDDQGNDSVASTATEFVGLVIGNLGGKTVKRYVDSGDSAIGAQINDLQKMDTSLGQQINDVIARVDTVAAAAGANSNRLDTISNVVDTVGSVLENHLTRIQINEAKIIELEDTTDALIAADVVLSARLDTVDAAKLDKSGDTVNGLLKATTFKGTNLYGDLYNAAAEVVVDVNAKTANVRSQRVNVIAFDTTPPAYDSSVHSGAFARENNSGDLFMGLGGAWVQITLT